MALEENVGRCDLLGKISSWVTNLHEETIHQPRKQVKLWVRSSKRYLKMMVA